MELESALKKRRSIGLDPEDEIIEKKDDFLDSFFKSKPSGPSGRRAPTKPTKTTKSSIQSFDDDFFPKKNDPETELSKNKVKSILDTSDSESDDDQLDFLKKERKTLVNTKAASLSSSNSSLNESIYSEDSFENDSVEEKSTSKSITDKSPKSARSNKSTKSITSQKSTINKTKIEEKSDISAATVIISSSKAVTPPITPKTPRVIATEPKHSTEVPVVLSARKTEEEPDTKTVNLLSNLHIEAKNDQTDLIKEESTEDDLGKRMNLKIQSEMKNQASKMGKSSRPTSAPVGAQLQKIIQNRRAGKHSKLPENYKGLGSTAALEDLQRFKSDGLNLEIQVC